MFTAAILMVVSAARILQNQVEDNYRTRQKASKNMSEWSLDYERRRMVTPSAFLQEKNSCRLLFSQMRLNMGQY